MGSTVAPSLEVASDREEKEKGLEQNRAASAGAFWFFFGWCSTHTTRPNIAPGSARDSYGHHTIPALLKSAESFRASVSNCVFPAEKCPYAQTKKKTLGRSSATFWPSTKKSADATFWVRFAPATTVKPHIRHETPLPNPRDDDRLKASQHNRHFFSLCSHNGIRRQKPPNLCSPSSASGTPFRQRHTVVSWFFAGHPRLRRQRHRQLAESVLGRSCFFFFSFRRSARSRCHRSKSSVIKIIVIAIVRHWHHHHCSRSSHASSSFVKIVIHRDRRRRHQVQRHPLQLASRFSE